MKKLEKDEKKYEMRISKTVNGIDEAVRPRFKALAHISDKLAELSKQYEEEIKQIEREAEMADKPLYQLRSLIIQGKPIDDAEDITIEAFDKRMEEIKDARYDKINIVEKEILKPIDGDGLPGFWLSVMKQDPMVGTQIEKKDEEILKYLFDIEFIRQEDSHDFILKFHFHPNDYMQNTVITKRYICEDNDKIKQID